MANKPNVGGTDIDPNIANTQEQADREAAEKAAQEQADREAAEKAAQEQADREAAEKATADKTTPADDNVSEAVVKAGKAILKNNPYLKVVYMTADGMGFFERTDALNHSRTLTNKSVTPVESK